MNKNDEKRTRRLIEKAKKGKFTHVSEEIHRGMEFCCDFCNDLLEIPNIWYLRTHSRNEHPSYAVCSPCMEAY